MKALLFAIVILAGLDITVNHGAGVHGVGMALAGIGHSIGGWVYYS